MNNRKTCSTHVLQLKNPFYRPWLKENCAASLANNNLPSKAIIAGGCAGGLETIVLYPLEYVKTQLQLEEKSGVLKKYSGIADCITKTVRNRGFFGLYRGIGIILCGSVPKAAVRFGCYETLKLKFLDENGNISDAAAILCGIGAGLTEATLVVTPMETIKVKFINDQRIKNPRFKGLLHGIKLIIMEKGLPGIYRGLVATIMKQCTNQGIRFFVIETLKRKYSNGDATAPIPKLLVAVIGAISGFVSVIVNTPVDVAKTRMQSLKAYKYKGNVDCVRKIWSEEGPKAFYKGLNARLIHVPLGVSVNFVIYYTIIDVLNKYLF